MLFSSATFIYMFLPAVLTGYYLFKFSRTLQNVFLLIASLFFYAWGEPKFVLVMILSIIVNYVFGLLVHRAGKKEGGGRARGILAASVVFNLAILFVFKYLVFTLTNLNLLFKSGITVPEIALPIGISFFTFQAMSYVFDVYYSRAEVQKNILYVGLYISFFPQLIAGPIVRYETVAEEIRNRRESLADFASGFERFVMGLGKKVLLANTFALAADKAFDAVAQGDALSVGMAWLGAVAYTLQIFFDFSGYSDMAIGLGRMFGFHFTENFNYPYISLSVSEFWRRWHISLGSWFRDYVYIPLGGSRVNKARLIRNLFVVWLLTGVWHGANWTFIVWGLMYFILLTAEKLTGFGKKSEKKSGKILRWIYTMLFVVVGWVIFRSDSIAAATQYIGYMFGAGSTGLGDGLLVTELTALRIHLPAAVLFSTPFVPWLREKTGESVVVNAVSTVLLFVVFVLSLASIVSSSYNPFIYFNF